MAKQRIVNTHFWRDNFILGLRPDERLLFLWVITNPSTDLCGAYEAALPTIELETGLKAKRILEIFEIFAEVGKVIYRDGWVIVRNFTRHQNGTSTNVKKGAERSLNACPDWVKDTLSTGIHSDPNRTLPRPEPRPEPEPKPKGLGRASAPPIAPEEKPPASDARRSHPAITALHEVAGIYPPKEIWDEVIDRLGVDVDIGRLKTCYAKWRARGYAKGNYTGIIDWYHDGIPEPNGNGKPKPNSNYREQREQEAVRDRAVIDAARARTAARQLSRRDAGDRERQLLGSGPDPDPG